MFKVVKEYGQYMFGVFFIFYFLYTFSNAMDISKEVVFATWLTIFLYLQSVGEFLYFSKKLGKPRLQDYLRLALFVTLVLNFMKLVNEANGNAKIHISTKVISLNDSSITLIMILIAFVVLDVAYLVMQSFKQRGMNNNSSYEIKQKNLVFALLIFSTISQVYMLASGLTGFGSDVQDTSGLLSLVNALFSILNPFSLIIASYIIFIEKYNVKNFQLIFYSAFIVQILTGLLSGMKENTLIPILYVGIVFLFSGAKIPKKIIYAGVFLIILLYPINTAYRNIIGNPYLNTGSPTLNMAIAMQKVFSTPLLQTLMEGSDDYAARGEMFPFLEYSINNESEWKYYKYMTRYITLPLAWVIPRAIWPDKPHADIGGVLYEQIVGVRTATAITPTSVGWAYFEGGVVFLIVIFFLIGIVFEIVDRGNHKKPMILLFYIIILHKALKPEWDPYFMFVALMQIFIMYWFLLKFIGIQERNYTHEN